jgi:hypothetical protein
MKILSFPALQISFELRQIIWIPPSTSHLHDHMRGSRSMTSILRGERECSSDVLYDSR